MDRQGIPYRLRQGHIATGVSILIGGLTILALTLAAYLRLETWLRNDYDVDLDASYLPTIAGAWYIVVGIVALVAAGTKNRCLHITDIAFSTMLIICMGIAFITIFIHLESYLHSGDEKICRKYPECQEAYEMLLVALLFKFVTYIIVIFNLIFCSKSLNKIPRVATFGNVTQTSHGVPVNGAPMAPASSWQNPAPQMPPAAGYNPYAPSPAYGFQHPNGSYVTVADKKKLVQSEA